VIVVDVKRATMETDEAEVTLPVAKRRDVSLGESVAPLQVMAVHTAVLFRLDLGHCPVMTGPAVRRPTRSVRPVAAELLDRLDLRTLRAVLHALRNGRMAAIGPCFVADRRLLLPVLGSVPQAETLPAVERQSVRGLLTAPELRGGLDLAAVPAPLFRRT
jgi:hypothetical protein